MRTIILYLAILMNLSVQGQVHVKGYTKSNGTYVAPYTRSSPNSSPYDNYSFPGNTNPYTGKTATGNPETYISNLYKNNNVPSTSDVWVESYYRRDGTYVTGHYRSAPNGNPYDNYSYPGNTNPYTEKIATVNRETYSDNYYSKTPTNLSSNYNFNSNSVYTYTSTKYVNTSKLNVRSGASTKCSIITSLFYGDQVEVIGMVNSSWTKVRVSYFDGYTLKTKTGYVYSVYISSSNPLY